MIVPLSHFCALRVVNKAALIWLTETKTDLVCLRVRLVPRPDLAYLGNLKYIHRRISAGLGQTAGMRIAKNLRDTETSLERRCQLSVIVSSAASGCETPSFARSAADPCVLGSASTGMWPGTSSSLRLNCKHKQKRRHRQPRRTDRR